MKILVVIEMRPGFFGYLMFFCYNNKERTEEYHANY